MWSEQCEYPWMQSSQGLCVLISAPSGAGKTTLKEKFMSSCKNFEFSVSHTTRPARDQEQDGRDYHFVSQQKFEELIEQNHFLEYAQVHQHWYGTGREVIERVQQGRNILLDVDVQGGVQIKRNFPEAVAIFIFPPSWQVLQERLQNRQTETVQAIEQRLHNAKEEMKVYQEYDYFLVADHVAHTLQQFEQIICAEQRRTNRWKVNFDDFFTSRC